MENLFAVSCCKPFLEKIYYFTYFLLALLLLSSFVKLGKGFLFMSEKIRFFTTIGHVGSPLDL